MGQYQTVSLTSAERMYLFQRFFKEAPQHEIRKSLSLTEKQERILFTGALRKLRKPENLDSFMAFIGKLNAKPGTEGGVA